LSGIIFFKVRRFYTSGDPIQPHLLRCKRFAVLRVQPHPLRLASAAASDRE
jgi:hypothetical protein